jgi:exopolysaccharide biosynthesis polyprenyl glycosylphosphotransferase
LALVLVDSTLVYLAFVLAYWMRYSLKIGPHIRDQVSFSAYQPLAPLLVGVMIAVLLSKGAYRVRLSTEVADEIITVFSAATITVASIVVVTTMLQNFSYSRGVIVYVWLLLIVLLAAGRVSLRRLQSWSHRHGWGVLRLLVVGATDVGKMVMQSVMSRPDLGYQLVGFVEQNGGSHGRDFGRFKALGTVDEVPDLFARRLVDEVIVALPASAHEESLAVLTLCEQHGIGLKLVPDLFEMSLSRVRVDDIAGIPLLDVQERPLRGLEAAVKRAFDILAAGILLCLTAPILAVLAFLIRLESKGPALLRQQRVGLGGHVFWCLKLRTMYPGAEDLQPALVRANEADGPLFKIRNDPRCTRVGRPIRRWSLDELPQLWNVLRGEMSIVGPRPALPLEVEQYTMSQRKRLDVKPGLTGLWQVSGRSDLPFDEMVLMDINYVENWSLAFDVKIVVRTVIAVLSRHGAY